MGFWVPFLVMSGITIALGVANYYLNRPAVESAKKQDFGQLNVPRAEEGAPIPLLYGHVLVRSPNIVWFGNYKALKHTRKVGGFLGIGADDVVTHYTYRLSLHFSLGMAGADFAIYKRTWLGNNKILAKTVIGDGENYEESLVVDNPRRSLRNPLVSSFVGDGEGFVNSGIVQNSKETIPTAIWYSPGTFTQVFDSSGTHPFGERTFNDQDCTPYGEMLGDTAPTGVISTTPGMAKEYGADIAQFMPNYRGQVMVYAMMWGFNSPNLELPAFEVIAPTASADMNFDTIGDGDANPACVLYDLLTNPWGRMGLDTELIDLDSFQAAAETLEEEQHGFSMIIYNANQAGEIIAEILKQIDGVMYEDTGTRKIVLKLIRDDVDPEDLPTLDESNVQRVDSFSTSTWEETYNEVRVVYNDRDAGFVDRVAVAQDQASIVTDRKRSATINFPGVSNRTLADKIAARELNAVSLPTASVRLTMNRDGFTLSPGDAFILSWDQYGIVSMQFRVQHVDFGTWDDNKVTIDAIQDRFAVDQTVFENDAARPFGIEGPNRLTRFHYTEAPRWILFKLAEAGKLANNFPRMMYLAAPPDSETAYVVQRSFDEEDWGEDMDRNAFGGTAKVFEAIYPRDQEPYDTTMGLRIYDVNGRTFEDATATEIQEYGKNLILVTGARGAELMAFESATDMGSGVYKLNNVWRGLLDTPAVQHVLDDDVYFLDDFSVGMFSRQALPVRDQLRDVSMRGMSRIGFYDSEEEDATVSEHTIKLRSLLPYPPQNLEINNSKETFDVEEETLTATWKIRSTDTNTITRGSTADEDLGDSGLAYLVTGTTDRDLLNKGNADDFPTGFFSWQEMTVVIPADNNTAFNAAQLGHGDAEIGVLSNDTVDYPDGSSVASAIGPWAFPKVPVHLLFWRNLLSNPRFDEGLDSWTTNSIVIDDDGPGLGHTTGNAFAKGSGAACTMSQTVRIKELGVDHRNAWKPQNLDAVLYFYACGFDADDTVEVKLEAMDELNSTVLASATTGTITLTGSWTRYDLTIFTLPEDTFFLKVSATMTAVGGGDTTASIGLDEFCLRIGQASSDLITNGSFEDGTTTGWTETVGTWTVETLGNRYSGEDAVKAGATVGSGDQMRQDITIPDGFQFGTAILEYARMNTGDNDSASVSLQARAGAVLLDDVQDPLGTISPADIWERKRLTLEIPETADTLRIVIFVSPDAGGNDPSAYFDDFQLRIFKQLDVDHEHEYDWSEPKVQKFPSTQLQFSRDFSSGFIPDLGMWDGSKEDGQIGSEPDMDADSDHVVQACKLVAWDGEESSSLTAFQFNGTGDIRCRGNVTFARFTEDDSFTAWVAFRVDEPGLAAARGLLGRLGTYGWSLEINSSGLGVAKLVGVSGTISVTGTRKVTDGGLHFLAIVYDAANDVLRIIDEDGSQFTSTAAGLGEIDEPGLTRFRIGRASSSQTPIKGQIARVYMWNSVVTAVDINSMWNHGEDPTDEIDSYTSVTTPVLTVYGTDDDGIVATRWGVDQIALAQSGGEWGLLTHPQFTNHAKSWDHTNTTYWASGGTVTVTTNDEIDPEGYLKATKIVGANAGYFQLKALDLGNTDDLHVRWMIKGNAAANARVELVTSAGVVKETHDFAVTTSWAEYSHTFTTWDATDTDARLRFYASDTGSSRTIWLARPIVVAKAADTAMPFCYPVPTTGATITAAARLIRITDTLDTQFNHEGEVHLVGMCPEASPIYTSGVFVNVHNGTNDNDRRTLAINTTGTQWEFTHYTGAGSGNTSEINEGFSGFDVRGRWNRAGLLEASSAFAGVYNASAQDYDRAATWTAGTVALDEIDVGSDGTGATAVHALITSLTLRSREEIL